MATGKKGSMTCTYIVGRYRPAGNMGGEYKNNVPKGKFTQDICQKTEQMAKDIDESVGKSPSKKKNIKKVSKSKLSVVDSSKSTSTNTNLLNFKFGKPFWRKEPMSDTKNKLASDEAYKITAFAANDDLLSDDEAFESQAYERQVGESVDNLEQNGLAAHNAFRKIHNTDPMILNPQLSSEAAAYAKVIADTGNLVHSNTEGKYGENLAMGCTSKNAKMSAEEATKNW